MTKQVKICWNPSTSVTNQNTTTLVNTFTCFWLCNVFCRCSYNCPQGFTLPGWLKNKPALRQVWKNITIQWWGGESWRQHWWSGSLTFPVTKTPARWSRATTPWGAFPVIEYIFSPHWQSHYQSYTQCSNNTVLFVSGDIIENMLTKAQEHSFAIDPLKRTLDSIVSTKQQTLIRKMMELSCLVLFWSIWENAIIVSSSVSSSCCEMWQKIIPLEWLFQRHVCIRKLGTNHLFIVVLSFFCREKAR